MAAPAALVENHYYRIFRPIGIVENAQYTGVEAGQNRFRHAGGVLFFQPNQVGIRYEEVQPPQPPAAAQGAAPMEVDGGKRRKTSKKGLRKTRRRRSRQTRRRK
jgi:hypothetical protein